ncbi:hypothetical protein BT69DRAFT_1338801 [Atractiella rhizophila]|nr:hypothetical protein BT69DRAFT_1338801 [Atractiella rhizophila]
MASGYIFTLPLDFLQSLVPRSNDGSFPATDQQTLTSDSETDEDLVAGGAPKLLTCAVCAVKAFRSVEEQREHWRSDWHRYNLKRKVGGREGVSEERWEEGVNSSISGSNSSVSSNEEEQRGPGSPLLWYTSNASSTVQYGIYRSVFPFQNTSLSSLQVEPIPLPNAKLIDPAFSTRKWTMLMFGGGHFAGAIISLIPGKTGKTMYEEVVLKSKTFHRYTTRRKQGGSQSAHDGGKGKASSAGATLRRYNEAALQDEVRELLNLWREDVDGSELVWLRCSKTNIKTFVDYEGCVLQRKDPKLRSFPFPTRRATTNELIRSFHELTHLKTSTLTVENVESLSSAPKPNVLPSKKPAIESPAPPPAPVPLTPEEIASKKATEMIRKGRLEALSNHINKNPSLDLQSLLHLASSSSQPIIVRWLLTEKQLDPKIKVNGRTAYEVSAGRDVRTAFRAAREEDKEGGDERWEGSGVPVGLGGSKEDDVANTKGKERKNRLKEKMKESRKAREAAIIEEENNLEEPPKEEKSSGRLGGVRRLKDLTVSDGVGLTEEQKMRLERERRARAAEARLGIGR